MELKVDGVMRNKNLKAKKKTKKEATLKNMMDHCDGAVKNKNLKADETEKPIVVSLEEAAAKMEPSHLADFLNVRSVPNLDLLRFYFYFESAFDQVSWTWVKMFKESLLSTLINVIPIKKVCFRLFLEADHLISYRFRFLIFLSLSTKYQSTGSNNIQLRVSFI
uniref:Uncharacterized protein n=1 Tax=Brassica oleracea var. oleracea TaxID=109376 RepID=A0A0D3D017_BRAOL